MKVKSAALALAIASVPVAANAADGFGPSIGSVGRWVAYSKIDAMTDERHCVALFDDRDNVQFTPRSIAIGFRGRGGISSYRVRLGDAPVKSWMPVGRMDQQLGAVFFEGKRRDEMVAAGRLRLEAITVLKGIVTEDISLTEAPELLALFSKNHCDGSPPPTASAPAGKSSGSPATDDTDRYI
jgi:hypothetical protein